MRNNLNILLKTIFQRVVGPKSEQALDVGDLSREELERLALHTQVKYKKCRLNHLISIIAVTFFSAMITYETEKLSVFSEIMFLAAFFSIYLFYRDNFENDLVNAQEALNDWFRNHRNY